ncbi:hypothetical protein Q7P36_002793 [Cladosporium allicinum]
MHFNLFLLPALIAAASAQPTESSKTNDVFARDEYRWCLGEKINSGTLRKFNWRMRGIDTGKVCADGNDAFGGIKSCLGQEACAASGGGFNCGADADGYVHGGINVGLGCSGDSIKRCIDQNLGISGNTDYVCNTTG